MAWHIQSYLLIIIFPILIIWYLNPIWKKIKQCYYSWNVPGPFSFPFIGIGHLFLGSQTELLNILFKIISEYPCPVKTWLGPKLFYGITDPQHVEKILSDQKCLNKNEIYNEMKNESFYEATGDGLFTAPESIWRRHRKLIQPSFNQKILDGFVDIFSEQSDMFTDAIKGHVGKKDVNINENISAFLMNILCESVMGLKVNSQEDPNIFARHLEVLMEIANIRIFHIWHHLRWTFKLYPISRVGYKHLEGLNSFTKAVIQKKLEQFNRFNGQKNDSIADQLEEDGGKQRLAFLDLMLKHGFTEKELMDEVASFMMAGTDTIATTLYFFFEVLGIYQDVQQKIYEEAVDILGECRSVEASDLPKFKYLERVIKETMRLFPAVPIIMRRVGENIKLDQYTIPEGASALISILNIHRDPKYWPDPLKFDPDRFLPEEVSKRPPCSFIVFSFGPRNCIGMKYAMMAMKTIIATTVRKYKILSEYKSAEEIEIMLKIVLRGKNPSKIYIERR